MNCRNRLHRKTGTVFCVAAIFINAVVEDCRTEAAAHPVAMYLHHIKTGLFCQHRRFSKPTDDGLNLPFGHLRDVRSHFSVQLFPQLVGGNLLHQNAGNVLEHRQQVGITLMQLGTDFTVRIVSNFHDLLVKCKPFGIKQRFFKFAFANRNIPNDDHGTAALCDGTDFGEVFLIRQSKRCRCKNDAVFQLHPTIVDRTQNRFVHYLHTFFCTTFCSNVSSSCRSCAVSPSRFCASQSVKT